MNDYLSEMLDSFSKKPEKFKHSNDAGELMKDMIMNRLAEKTETGESA